LPLVDHAMGTKIQKILNSNKGGIDLTPAKTGDNAQLGTGDRAMKVGDNQAMLSIEERYHKVLEKTVGISWNNLPPETQDLIKDKGKNEDFWNFLTNLTKQAKAHAVYLFRDGFPTVKKLFTQEQFDRYWPDLMEIGKVKGVNAYSFYRHSLPSIKKIFNNEQFDRYWPGLVELGKASNNDSKLLFTRGLASLKNQFTEEEFDKYWNTFVELGNEFGENVYYLFFYSIPAVRTLIKNEEDLKKVGSDLVALQKTERLLRYGLPTLKKIFNQEDLEKYWPILVENGIAAKEDAGVLFQYGLPFVRKLIKNEADLKRICNILIEGAIRSKHGLAYFRYALPEFKSSIKNENDLKIVVKGLSDLCNAVKGEELIHFFKYDIPRLKEFLGKDFKKYWPDLVELGKTAENDIRVLFNDIIPDLMSLGNWDFYKAQLYNLFKETTDYNRERILNELHSSEILKNVKNKGGDPKKHFVFYIQLLHEYPRLGVQIWEGLFKAIKEGDVNIELTDIEKETIRSFIKIARGFNPVFYRVYNKKGGEKVFESILEMGNKALADELKINDLNKYQAEFNQKGYDGFELVLAGIQRVIPSSGASFIMKNEVANLLKNYMAQEDKNGDLPDSLRGLGLFGGKDITMKHWVLKDGEQFDANGELRQIVEWMRNQHDLDIDVKVNEEMRDSDKRLFIKALELYLKDRTNLEEQKKVLQAFLVYARHNDLLKEKVDRIHFGDYVSIELLEQLFYDKDNLSVLLREVMEKDINPELFEKKGDQPIKDVKGLIGKLNNIWFNNNLGEDKKVMIIGNMLRGYKISDVEQQLLTVEGLNKELGSLIIALMGNLRTSISILTIINEIFENPLKIIRTEKAKFKSMESEDKIKLRFRGVKSIPYSLWGLLAGVCIAGDVRLWNKKEFYLLAMIDEESQQAVGFIHMYEQIIDGRRVLTVPGIEPSVEFMGKMKAEEMYPLIVEALRTVAKTVGYEAIYLPTDANILSNRSGIMKQIELKKYKTAKIPEVKWNTVPTPYPFDEVYELPLVDHAMGTKIQKILNSNKGGIDLTPANMNLQTQNNGDGIKFHLDPAMLKQLQNAPGFVPVIINIQPLKSLPEFLGLNQSVQANVG
jgi:hypothetical protein